MLCKRLSNGWLNLLLCLETWLHFHFLNFSIRCLFSCCSIQKIKWFVWFHVYRTPAFECSTMIMTSEENGCCVAMFVSHEVILTINLRMIDFLLKNLPQHQRALSGVYVCVRVCLCFCALLSSHVHNASLCMCVCVCVNWICVRVHVCCFDISPIGSPDMNICFDPIWIRQHHPRSSAAALNK